MLRSPRLIHRLLSLLVVTALNGGCSDEPTPAASGGDPTIATATGGGGDVEAPGSGVPATAVATVTPASTAAGDPATVGCQLMDTDGRPMADAVFTYEVQPGEGVTQSGVEVTGSTPGEHKILCSFASAPGVAQQPATWTVTPGAPASLVIRFEPDKPGYMPGEPVTVLATALDAAGNVQRQSAAIGTLGAVPEAGVKVNGAVLTFQEEGAYTVTASAAGAPDVTASKTLLVDGTPPKIAVQYPERGANLVTGGVVGVTGKVTDDRLQVTWLKQDEGPRDFDPATGAFAFDWTLGFGINRLALSAADAAGNVAHTWRSALYSTQYYPMDPPAPETEMVPDGLAVTLTQEAVDDGDHDTAHVNDLATLVEVLMSNLDLEALLGGALGDFLGCEYLVEKLTYDSPGIHITLGNGDIAIKIELNNFKVWIKNSGANKDAVWPCTLNDGAPDGPSWATGPLKFEADRMLVDATVELGVSKDGPQITVRIDKVDFENMWGIDIPVIQDIVDWAIEAFITLVKPVVEGLLSDTFGGLLDSFALNQALDIPNLGGGAPNTVVLSTQITDIQVSPASLRIRMKAMAAAQQPLRPHPSLGVAAYVGCEPTGTLPPVPLSPLMAALHTDVLNELLFAVWDGGTLNGKLDPSVLGDFDLSAYGVSDLDATLDARLPLLFNPCGGQQILQIGDLWLDATLNFGGTPSRFAFWLQGQIPLDITVATAEDGSTTLGVNLDDLSGLNIEVAINEGLFEGDDAGLVEVMEGFLLPQLIGGLAGSLSAFALPEIDLGSLVPGLPPGSLKLSLDIHKIGAEGGYVQLLGGLK